VVVLLAAILVLYQGDTAARFRRPVLRSRLVALAAMAMMITMTVFPPVTRPWWATPSQPPTNALPRFAIIMDSRFDASRNIPSFAIHKSVLLLEWLATIAVAAAIWFTTTKRPRLEAGEGSDKR